MSARRTPNFTKGEESILMRLINKYIDIIENKQTDSVTNNKKKNTWQKIGEEFLVYTGVSRSDLILKNKYHNLKKKAKLKLTEERRQIVTAEEKIIDNNEDVLRGSMGHQLTGWSNQFEDHLIEEQPEIKTEIHENDLLENISENEEKIVEEAESASTEPFSGVDNSSMDWATYTPSNLKSRWEANRSKKNIGSQFRLWAMDKREETKTRKELLILESQQRRAFAAEKHNLEMEHLKEKHILEMKMKKEAHQLQILILKEQLYREKNK